MKLLQLFQNVILKISKIVTFKLYNLGYVYYVSKVYDINTCR